MQRPVAALTAGMQAMAPILPSVVPFGVTAGIAALDAGLGPEGAFGMAVIVFAGASQIAAAQLIGQDALAVVVVLTVWIINLRMAMYSASLAPHFAGLPKRWKWPLAYLLTDQAYAVSITRFHSAPEQRDRHWFYLGCALPLWVVWLLATGLGIWVGASVPASWQLNFTIPLIFMALLVSAVYDRPTVVAALTGGGVAVAAHGLPFHLGLIAAALCGVVAGVVAEVLRERPRRRLSMGRQR